MQTFLPYASFPRSASVLDRQRMGKQRVEAKQIMRALRGESKGWVNHPTVRMWRGQERFLAQYGLAVCQAWRAQGYRDSLLAYFADLADMYPAATPPTWFGNEDFHLSHQAHLIRKLPEYYRPIFGPDVSEFLPLLWPA